MLDASIVATSLFTIGIEFDDLERINWVALAYTLSFLGCAVFFARMADIVGRRNAFVAAFIIFFSFSLGCGFSQSLDSLIACRALQGIGGSGLFSVTMIIFPEMSPPKSRKFLAPLIGMVISTSGVLGPVLGGLFTHYTTWRWVFWIKWVDSYFPACYTSYCSHEKLTAFAVALSHSWLWSFSTWPGQGRSISLLCTSGLGGTWTFWGRSSSSQPRSLLYSLSKMLERILLATHGPRACLSGHWWSGLYLGLYSSRGKASLNTVGATRWPLFLLY